MSKKEEIEIVDPKALEMVGAIGGESLLASAWHHGGWGLIGRCGCSPAQGWLLGVMCMESFLSKCDLVRDSATSVCFGWTGVLKQEDMFFILDIISQWLAR